MDSIGQLVGAIEVQTNAACVPNGPLRRLQVDTFQFIGADIDVGLYDVAARNAGVLERAIDGMQLELVQ